MNGARIVVTSPSFSKNEELKSEIESHFKTVTFNEKGDRLDGKALIEFMDDARGAVIGLERMDKSVISECRHLRIISKYGVGLDNIDLEYCKEHGIAVRWTPGINRTSVAEMTLAFMIMLGRNILKTSIQLKGGTWNKNGGYDLHGKTVGIIGVGNIGKEVVRLLKPFECRIMANDIIEQSEYYDQNGLEKSSKEEIFKLADYITIHTPLTDLTVNMINRRILSKMKRSAFVINTARGPIIDSFDLKWALKNNVIAGAALDVYAEEPPQDSELLAFGNLICTPHIGGNSYESVLSMGRSAIGHLRDFFYTGIVE